MAEQQIRFIDTRTGRVAAALVGAGPPLVLPPYWLSHVEEDWANPPFAAWVRALARRHTVVRYDRVGTGLAQRDRATEDHTIAAEAGTLLDVVDALGLDAPVALLAFSSGGPVALRFAADHPDRVARVVFYGSYAHGDAIADPSARAALVDVVARHWALGSRVLASVFLPDGDPIELERFVRFQRTAADPAAAAALLELVYDADEREACSRIDAPTLVLHRRGDRTIPLTCGVDLARRIAGARLMTLDGELHLPWHGDAGAIAAAVDAFLAGDDPSATPDAMPAPATGHDSGPLTAREREVLALVAAGLADAEIAQRLVLSPHTVHRHVANIRTKLDQPSRAAAAAAAARRGLI